MRWDYQVELVNDSGGTRKKTYGPEEGENDHILNELSRAATLEAISETENQSWRVETVICEPILDEEEVLEAVLEKRGAKA